MQTTTKTKTKKTPSKKALEAFWAARAAKIAASRAKNEKSGMTERERRAQRKLERERLAAKGATKSAAKKSAATPPRATSGKTLSAPPKPRAVKPDADAAAYVARLSRAIEKATKPAQRAYVARYLGADAGGGWAIVATDGHRALLQQVAITNDAKVAKPLVSAEGPAFGFDLTADIEAALRADTSETVTLEIDGARRRLTVRATGLPAITKPVVGTVKTATLLFNRRFLLDGFGRGGRLRYDVKPDRVVIETPDAVRYVVMKMQPPTIPTTTTVRAKPTTKSRAVKTTTPNAAQLADTTPSVDPLGAAQ